LTKLYEGMFLLDNQVVREDFKAAKRAVTDTLAKHSGEVLSARRWDERRLAYPVKHRRRATYFLAYFKAPATAGPLLRRDFELDERILRYLIVSADEVPASELELAAAEDAADFVAPAPPGDDDATDRDTKDEPQPAEGEEVVADDMDFSDDDSDRPGGRARVGARGLGADDQDDQD
jgi:small subunit ribosomal protein S6